LGRVEVGGTKGAAAGIVVVQVGNVTEETGACLASIGNAPTPIGCPESYAAAQCSTQEFGFGDCAKGVDDVCKGACHARAQTKVAQLKVKLNSKPRHDVTVPITVDNDSEGVAYPKSLTFTSLDWNTTKSVTVKGVDDYMYDKNVTYKVTVGPGVSDDTKYQDQHASTYSFLKYRRRLHRAECPVRP
jgi:hypothetical protein